jgi:hypothetical protein
VCLGSQAYATWNAGSGARSRFRSAGYPPFPLSVQKAILVGETFPRVEVLAPWNCETLTRVRDASAELDRVCGGPSARKATVLKVHSVVEQRAEFVGYFFVSSAPCHLATLYRI